MIYSDHQLLRRLFSETEGVPQMAAARIQRWALTLAAYEYTIAYQPGKELTNANALSCLPLHQRVQVPLPGDLLLKEHLNTVSRTLYFHVARI